MNTGQLVKLVVRCLPAEERAKNAKYVSWSVSFEMSWFLLTSRKQ